MLFKYLVQSVMVYGVEIWGWEEKKELEKVMIDYIRWVYSLNFCTPRYVITRELDLDRQGIEWSIRAMRYEARIKEMKKEALAKKCWEEKSSMKIKELYSMEREMFYNKNGWSLIAKENFLLESSKNLSISMEGEIKLRSKDTQRQMEEGKIREAKYNKRYRKIKTKGRLPKYLGKVNLKNEKVKKKVKALIRLRCGNMEEGNKYLLEKEMRKCVFCETEQDRIEHFVKECKETKNWFIKV